MNKIYVLINCKTGTVEEVRDAIAKIEGVSEVSSVTGRCDIIARLEGPNLNKLLVTVAREIHKVKGVEKTETLVAPDLDISDESQPVLKVI